VQGGQDYFRFVEGTCIIVLCHSSLSLSVLSAAFRFWLSLQKLNSICFWSVTSVRENEEKVNTIQPPPPSCVFLTFTLPSSASFILEHINDPPSIPNRHVATESTSTTLTTVEPTSMLTLGEPSSSNSTQLTDITYPFTRFYYIKRGLW